MYGHVVITGASSGFGMAFARRLGGECAHMVLVARRKDVLMELADDLYAACPPEGPRTDADRWSRKYVDITYPG